EAAGDDRDPHRQHREEEHQPALDEPPFPGDRVADDARAAGDDRHPGLLEALHLGVGAGRPRREVAGAARAGRLARAVDEPAGIATGDALSPVQPRGLPRPNQHDSRIASASRAPRSNP
ncbi:MAG: hypothetical protein ACK55I_01965, partial [bacterium]